MHMQGSVSVSIYLIIKLLCFSTTKSDLFWHAEGDKCDYTWLHVRNCSIRIGASADNYLRLRNGKGATWLLL